MKKPHTNRVYIGHGKFTYKRSSGSVYISAIKAGGMITSGFVMPKDMYKENAQTSSYQPAHTSGATNMGGFSVNKQLEIPNGHILKLVNNRKKNGREYLNACMLILVHDNAGVIRVDASLPHDTRNAIGDRIMVYEGKGIILQDEDVYSLQYDMNGIFIKKYRDLEEIAEAFYVTEVTQGVGVGEFNATKRANGVVDIVAKRVQPRRKITMI